MPYLDATLRFEAPSHRAAPISDCRLEMKLWNSDESFNSAATAKRTILNGKTHLAPFGIMNLEASHAKAVDALIFFALRPSIRKVWEDDTTGFNLLSFI